MSRPPGDWTLIKPIHLHRVRCCWCGRRPGINRPSLYWIAADGPSEFAILASPVCSRCAGSLKKETTCSATP